MNIVDTIRGWLPSRTRAQAADPLHTADTTANEAYWRKIGQRRYDYDLHEIDQRRAQQDSIKAWRGNAMCKRHVDIATSLIVGDQEANPRVEMAQTEELRETAQRLLDEFWFRNRMDRQLAEWCSHWCATGEVFLTLFTGGDTDAEGRGSQRTQVGFLDPLGVSHVLVDVDDCHTRIGAVVTRENVKPMVYPFVQGDGRLHPMFRTTLRGEEIEIPAEMCVSAGFAPTGGGSVKCVVGAACMYLPANVTPGQTRGLPDAYPVLDLLGAWDEFVFGASERGLNANAVTNHVVVEGADKPELDKWKKTWKAAIEAGTGQALFTNEKVTLNRVVAALQAQDFKSWEGVLILRIAAGFGDPEHWYSSGGNVNTSTAGEMAGVAMVTYAQRQARFMGFIEDVVWYALRKYPEMRAALDEDPDCFDILIPRPDLISKDAQRGATVLNLDLQSLSFARDEGAISDEEFQRLARESLGRHDHELFESDKPDPAEVRRGLRGMDFPPLGEAPHENDTAESQAANPPRTGEPERDEQEVAA